MGGQTIQLKLGDSFKILRELGEGSIGSVVCDPPYLISFMGKDWDKLDPESETGGEGQAWHSAWLKEAYRVLKPGGVIKVFGATRTFHRLAAAMEAVGFENLSIESWAYGSGFPKSLSLSKAIDRHLGVERTEVIGEYNARGFSEVSPTNDGRNQWAAGGVIDKPAQRTAPVTPEAIQFEGYGTALKPAWEPFVVGRKPL